MSEHQGSSTNLETSKKSKRCSKFFKVESQYFKNVKLIEYKNKNLSSVLSPRKFSKENKITSRSKKRKKDMNFRFSLNLLNNINNTPKTLNKIISYKDLIKIDDARNDFRQKELPILIKNGEFKKNENIENFNNRSYVINNKKNIVNNNVNNENSIIYCRTNNISVYNTPKKKYKKKCTDNKSVDQKNKSNSVNKIYNIIKKRFLCCF